jgi:hypothetical protein
MFPIAFCLGGNVNAQGEALYSRAGRNHNRLTAFKLQKESEMTLYNRAEAGEQSLFFSEAGR